MRDASLRPTSTTSAFGPIASPWALGLACGAVLVVWFVALATRHLLPADEGRYAEIAREMFATGDWVTIRYHGVKYFEKPPFHLWMTALSYHAFGVGEWQARLWSAVSGLIGLLATMMAARRWFGSRVAWLSGLVLLAAPTWNLSSHFNSLDMSVSGALACVLAGLLMAQHPSASAKAQRNWMLFSWAAMAVAVLTKGLIGIALPGMVLVLYTLIARDWALWRRLHLVAGPLVFFAIAAPWFVLVSQRNPEFAQFFFIHEHWDRYTSTAHRRGAPVWYFVPQLLLGFLPWLGLAPRICATVKAEEAPARGFRPLWLLSVWALAIFAFFSLSDSKLPGYIVPVFPALAILAAVALDKLDAAAWRRQLLGLTAVFVLALVASPLVGRMGSDRTPTALYQSYGVWATGACVLVLAGLLASQYLNRIGLLFRSIAAMALALFAGATVALVGHDTLGRSNSGADLVPAIESVLTPQMPIYSVRRLDHTLPFYLRRTTTLVELPDELEFGLQQEPEKWLPTMAEFVAVWSSGPHALAVMSPATYELLKAERVPMFPIAQDVRRVVVANFQRPSP